MQKKDYGMLVWDIFCNPFMIQRQNGRHRISVEEE